MPAGIIAAGVSAVASVGGAALSSSASKKAANKAVAAQTATTESNNALQQGIYDQNKQTLSPDVQSGNQANAAIMELLGYPQQQSQPANAMAGGVDWAKYTTSQPDAMNDWQTYHSGMDQNAFGQWHYQRDGSQRDLTPYTTQSTAQPTGTNALSAFDTYKNSNGYQFRMNEGLNALASNLRARGVSQSGAAMKSMLRYGQDYGSNEFGKYIGYLGNQQGVGLSAASAQAGVGQNYANALSANNQNQADALGNAALLKGQANNSLYGAAAGAIGNIAGNFLTSSYGR
jgi:hypothetical protein